MKLYIDTSVFGGYFENVFEEWTKPLIDRILYGDHLAVVSDITLMELEEAPENVKDLAERIISENAVFITSGKRENELADEYLKDQVITHSSRSDALHIAAATINNVDVLVSWNFKHIVNLQKIRQYNAVNLKFGYSFIEIRSPMEIVPL